MNKTATPKKAETAVRTDKYPHSDNDWKTLMYLHINRLPSAATFMAYHHQRESSERTTKSQSEYFQSLNGTWKFSSLFPFDQRRPMDFFEKGHDVRGWGNIKVPTGEMEGGHPFTCRCRLRHQAQPATDCVEKQSCRFLQTHIQRPCQLERANQIDPPLRRRGLNFLCGSTVNRGVYSQDSRPQLSSISPPMQ